MQDRTLKSSLTPPLITAEALQSLFKSGNRVGLIDVREEGEFNSSHIPSAVCVPRRVLESRIAQLFPYKGEQLVVCDDTGSRALRAAQSLLEMGYNRTALLSGGVNRWFSEDRPTEWGINVPSKKFGEIIQVQEQVPNWTALTLAQQLARGTPIKIFDTRTPEEFGRFSIPGAECIPNVEIALRAAEIRRQHPDATLVINCGGRTRSIIGASTLLRMGLNNVVALKNGTSGWVLAGFDTESGNTRVRLDPPSAEGLMVAESYARKIAQEDGVRFVDIEALSVLRREAETETVYCIDVRTREEYLNGHVPGFAWFPGGQAIQRSDDAAPFRDAPIVFCCDKIARAAITASWFRRMGYSNVMAVNGGVEAWQAASGILEIGDPFERPFGFEQLTRLYPALSPKQLLNELSADANVKVFFIGTSREYTEGHIPKSTWLSRSWLDIKIADICDSRKTRIILTDAGGLTAPMGARDLRELGYTNCATLQGGLRAWTGAGFDTEYGLTNLSAPPEDVLPTIPQRSYENMMNYLRWEEALGGDH